MRALSIQEPWAAAIALGRKPIENRTWTTSYRGQLLLHASKTLDLDWFTRSGDFCLRLFRDIYGTDLGQTLLCAHDFPTGGIIGICMLTDIVQSSESVWFTGPYGWCLTDAHPLPFLPCRGRLGLFEVDAEIAGAVELLLSDQSALREMREGGVCYAN